MTAVTYCMQLTPCSLILEGLDATRPTLMCMGALGYSTSLSSMLSEYTWAVMAQPRNQMALKMAMRMEAMGGMHCGMRGTTAGEQEGGGSEAAMTMIEPHLEGDS